ncbi:DoxX family protein [Nocardia goodfellowii]
MHSTDLALLLVRLVVGGTLIAHGVNHWLGGGKIAGTARWFSGLGLRYGTVQAWLSVVTEIGAGALLILGLLTPAACAAVVSVMLIAGWLAHRPNGFFVFREGYEYVLVLGVVALALAVLGPGSASIDAAAEITIAGWTGGALALGLGLAGTVALLVACWRPEPADTPSEAAATGDRS